MGSLSLDADPKLADLALVAGGGDEFLARLKSLQEAKQKHDAALAALMLGVDIKRAKDDAQEKQRLADDALAKAQAQAQQVREAAQAEADAILHSTRTRHDEAMSAAASHTADVQGKADALLQNAQAKQSEAQTLRDTAARLQAEAKTLKQDLEQQMTAALAQRGELDKLRADLQNKRALLLATAARLKE